MPSSVTDTAKDIGRKLVNRAETVVGDDAREAVKRAKYVVQDARSDYRYFTGSGRKKTAPKSGRKTSSRSN